MLNPASVPARTGIALFAIYALLTCGFDVSEGRDDVELARNILRTGSLAMEHPLNPNWVRGVDGRYYSAHEGGNAVALLPAVFAADAVARELERFFPSTGAQPVSGALLPLAAAAYVALTAAAFCLCLVRVLRLPAHLAIAVTFALGLTTILAPYSRMLFDGVLASALIAWALAFAAIAASGRSSGATSSAAALGAGLLAGAAFATRQPLALLAIPVFTHLAVDGRSEQRTRLLTCFILGALPGVLWQGWYNTLRTGAPWMPAVALPQFRRVNGQGNLLEGLAGLLLSPGKSLFIFSPLLVLAPFGWNRLRRLTPGLAWGLLVGIASYLLLHAQIRNWSGDWGWGPRYAVPVTMLLMLPAALAIQSAFEQTSRRRIVFALSIAGACVQAVAFGTNWHYCYAWLAQHGLFDRTAAAWSLSHGQLAVNVVWFARNMARMAGASIEPFVVSGASAITVATGNGVNVWPTAAIAAGLPAPVVIGAAVVGLGCVILTIRWALAVSSDSGSVWNTELPPLIKIRRRHSA